MADLFGWAKRPGELLKSWPKTAEGEPVPPALLTHCASVDMEDILLVNMLESFGIPTVMQHPGDGEFGKVVLGMSGTGSCIFVPETMLDQARELMEAEPDDDIQS